MNHRTKIVIAATAIAGAVLAGTSIAVAGPAPDDTEAAITGATLDQAGAAALAHTGGGRVTDTEVGDEESYYEVEVTFDDGNQVDVQLDKSLNVVTQNPDVETAPGD